MRRLILMGDIGSGKTTLIRRALGPDAARAGGFVTMRMVEKGIVTGFDLAPARYWAEENVPAYRFLDLTRGPIRDDSVFSGPGAKLLAQAMGSPFAVADEFGGLELLVPEFYEGLLALLSAPVPLIGVMKTPEAQGALASRVPLGKEFSHRAQEIAALLRRDPDTCILPLSGWDDPRAGEAVRNWIEIYVRR